MYIVRSCRYRREWLGSFGWRAVGVPIILVLVCGCNGRRVPESVRAGLDIGLLRRVDDGKIVLSDAWSASWRECPHIWKCYLGLWFGSKEQIMRFGELTADELRYPQSMMLLPMGGYVDGAGELSFPCKMMMLAVITDAEEDARIDDLLNMWDVSGVPPVSGGITKYVGERMFKDDPSYTQSP